MRILRRTWHHMRSYHDAERWIFMKGHTLPLPLSHVRGVSNGEEWHYANHCLSPVHPHGPFLTMGWLSAKVVTENREYEMDTFLSHFRVKGGIPTLSHVFLAWCAETHRWFPPMSAALHVIDEEGETQIYGLDRMLDVHGRRLYVIPLQGQAPIREHQHVHLADPYTYYHA